MRDEILDYLKSLKLKNFNISDELPFSNSGTAMYLKNAKRVYVDLEQVTTEPFINLFGNYSIDSEIHSVRLYFSTDAKQLPSDYSTTVSGIRLAKSVTTSENYFRRDVTSSTSFENDLMITEFEFRFTKLTT
jgi:hypothetical protein